MPVKVRKYIKPSSARPSRPLTADSEAPTVKGAPVAPRRIEAATITGREWRVDPLVAGLSLAAALLIGVVISSLMIARARPVATSALGHAATVTPLTRPTAPPSARSGATFTAPMLPARPAFIAAIVPAPAVKPVPKPVVNVTKPTQRPVVRRVASPSNKSFSKRNRKPRYGKPGKPGKHGRYTRYARSYRFNSSDLRRIRSYFYSRLRSDRD